jgi:3-hydroxyacyl-[acyl-carrier-protein] dehydratase
MSSLTSNSDVPSRIKAIIRRDLKLGTEMVIADEMPFWGGEIDLDSLDILLVMTSIEKEFGLRIPSEEVGKRVFQNVATLTTYVLENSSGAAAGRPAEERPAVVLEHLPHREPFRFVTRITAFVAGDGEKGPSAEGVWAITGEEAFFAGHFPGNPLVPGVLIGEALAQLSGLAGSNGRTGGGMLARIDLRFEAPVIPPAELLLHTQLASAMGELAQFDVWARLKEVVVARGTLALRLTGAGRPA